jgi:hypothetical protein
MIGSKKIIEAANFSIGPGHTELKTKETRVYCMHRENKGTKERTE